MPSQRPPRRSLVPVPRRNSDPEVLQEVRLNPEALDLLVKDLAAEVRGLQGIVKDHIRDTVEEQKKLTGKLGAIQDLLAEILLRLPEKVMKP